ncbi:type-F conjugative transfer system pilin assembly protein TraF [Serratia sp. UGAL515B_01]|uniref:type-F conjugative transfer system pilin assembly protein TraF n=1 Tax=Serratia sp. UGAL515B_01 TaxID=2986763 RepID=UPI002954558B|nr:type-F conjugative transfer system pilin assembly protein TraF [Serratia sp. UGAL515B_01]WON75532.1 type-F conjugative transfer system pilin assembly protein TraF [Serratia sp. UGAL515B_01]
MIKYAAVILGVFPLVASAGDNAKANNGYDYNPAVGWYWYNTPKPQEEKPERQTPPPPANATETMSRLHAKRLELINKALINPTEENIRRYVAFQKMLVNQVSQFSSGWEKVLLNNPELDYNLKHPVYNGASPIEYTKERQLRAKAIDYINQRYGVFFFYRGNEPLDNRLGNVVREFSEQYGIPFIPVTVDGRINPDLPQTRTDAGQAERMNITHFPAIFLVEPARQTYKPLAYGFITQDDLARRVLNVVTDFKPRD